MIETGKQASLRILGILSDLGLARHRRGEHPRTGPDNPSGAFKPISEKENDAIWEEIGAR